MLSSFSRFRLRELKSGLARRFEKQVTEEKIAHLPSKWKSVRRRNEPNFVITSHLGLDKNLNDKFLTKLK